LIGDLVLLAIWAVLYWWRRDVRREMLVVSSIFGSLGLIAGYFYTVDWWHPLTITGTRVGVEDMIFAFGVAGIAAVIYEEVFKKKVKPRKVGGKKKLARLANLFIVGLFLVGLFLGGMFILVLHSFWASIISFTSVVFIIWARRRDLILDSLASGLLLVVVCFPAFWIPEWIPPGVIRAFWDFKNLSGILILKVPLEDVVWFFLIGSFIGPLWEYWQEGKLVSIKK
jgi:hypothetical protein